MVSFVFGGRFINKFGFDNGYWEKRLMEIDSWILDIGNWMLAAGYWILVKRKFMFADRYSLLAEKSLYKRDFCTGADN